MLTIFVLFVGLTLATAVIAYWSDNLGKKLGKKRVSLWGMRPRTTATFLTIASSWLIMLFTLCVMLVIFPPLRQALLKYDEVKATESDLKASTKQLKGQLVELNSQTDKLEDQVSDASGNLAKVQTQLNQSRKAAEQARKSRDQAQKDADQARQNAAAATERQRTAVERERAASDNLQKVSGQLGATKKQRAAAERQLNVAQTDLNKANANVKSANAQVKLAERNLQNVQTDLEKARRNEKIAKTNADQANARAENSNQQRKNADAGAIKSLAASIQAQAKVTKAQKKVDALEEQSKKLLEDNKALLAENGNFADVTGLLLSNNVRVPVGTVLSAQNFAQGVSFYQAKDDLDALFARADEIARGYKDNDKNVPGLLPGAKLTLSPRLVPAPDLDSSDNQKFVSVEGEEIYNGLAEAISRSQNPLSVRLVAERNHLSGDAKLSVRFIVVPIRSALPANDLLVSARIDGAANDAVVFNKLSELADVARDVATDAGVAPPLWRDSRNFYAPGSNEQVFDTLREIRAINGPARVRIVTAQPISTADLLSVKFEVEPVNSPTTPVTTTATARLSPRANSQK